MTEPRTDPSPHHNPARRRPPVTQARARDPWGREGCGCDPRGPAGRRVFVGPFTLPELDLAPAGPTGPAKSAHSAVAIQMSAADRDEDQGSGVTRPAGRTGGPETGSDPWPPTGGTRRPRRPTCLPDCRRSGGRCRSGSDRRPPVAPSRRGGRWTIRCSPVTGPGSVPDEPTRCLPDEPTRECGGRRGMTGFAPTARRALTPQNRPESGQKPSERSPFRPILTGFKTRPGRHDRSPAVPGGRANAQFGFFFGRF